MTVRGLFTAFLLLASTPAVAQEKTPPYWASIASGQAMTHTGPGRNYPNVWLYQRRDLPVRVVKKYQTWRLIQDPDGAQGWMLVTMLSDRRTAIVKPGQPRPIRVDRSEAAKVHYRAEPGVVGRDGDALAHLFGHCGQVRTIEPTARMRCSARRSAAR